MLKKIIGKIKLEIKCYRADADALQMAEKTLMQMYRGFGWIEKPMYMPSFYIRYTPEEQEQIKERDHKKIKELLDSLDD